MKTKRDISISLILTILGLALFLPLAFSEPISQMMIVQFLMAFALLIIVMGLLKIEKVQILGNTLTKTNFIFRRSIALNSIQRYKMKPNNMDVISQFNIAGFLKLLKNGARYSNYRILTIYPEGKWRIKIDERTMPASDFKKVLAEVKKGQKSN